LHDFFCFADKVRIFSNSFVRNIIRSHTDSSSKCAHWFMYICRYVQWEQEHFPPDHLCRALLEGCWCLPNPITVTRKFLTPSLQNYVGLTSKNNERPLNKKSLQKICNTLAFAVLIL
jgi:hypothetical protein